MTQLPENPTPDEHQPDDPPPTDEAADPTSYAPQEPASDETGTVYERATGEPAVTPADELVDDEEDEL
ncbi:hypothetical protein [Nocardioides sp. SYSU DS0663]|uniref:hypothetical protein n=1 Tax=Nocardioides sp. SYSU DS0663 TaxID=3416445 RepID=UPI003F4BC134